METRSKNECMLIGRITLFKNSINLSIDPLTYPLPNYDLLAKTGIIHTLLSVQGTLLHQTNT